MLCGGNPPPSARALPPASVPPPLLRAQPHHHTGTQKCRIRPLFVRFKDFLMPGHNILTLRLHAAPKERGLLGRATQRVVPYKGYQQAGAVGASDVWQTGWG